ncbi:MAG: hypothetical protein J4473_00955 [Candidatus Aenigmarchaeota archaeon]|nr:hypothetical protein [Candidatus Aenigmarchaeota archaeon]
MSRAIVTFGRTASVDAFSYIKNSRYLDKIEELNEDFLIQNLPEILKGDDTRPSIYDIDREHFTLPVLQFDENGNHELHYLKPEFYMPFIGCRNGESVLYIPLKAGARDCVDRIDVYFLYFSIKQVIGIGYFGQFSRNVNKPGFTVVPSDSVNYDLPFEIPESMPSEKLQKIIHESYGRYGIEVRDGIIMSKRNMSDIPQNEIDCFESRGVIGVDMETAAFLDYCNRHNIAAGSILIAGDPVQGTIFDREMKMYCRDKTAIKPMQNAVEIATEILSCYKNII